MRFGGVEILASLSVAVRDAVWDTVPAAVADVVVDGDPDAFGVTFSARHRSPEIAFDWQGSIAGRADGTLEFSMAGATAAACRYARIGLVLLHPPAEYAGRPYRAPTPGGSARGVLPDDIEPQYLRDGIFIPVAGPFTQLAVDLRSQVTVDLAFEGDLFEIEDQRNWTDDSFKTYSTPMALGYPHAAVEAQRFEQRLRLAVGPAPPARRVPRDDVVRIALGAPRAARMPRVGLGMGGSLAAPQVELLRILAPDHLRVELDACHDASESELAQAGEAAAALGTALELAVLAAGEDVERVARLVEAAPVAVARVLLCDRGGSATPRALVAAVAQRLADRGVDVPVGAGAAFSFAEINRDREECRDLALLSWAICPQVHAFGDLAVMSTLPAQAATVRCARGFAPSATLAVSPVTLRMRSNPDAPAASEVLADGLSATVDPRQSSLFCAAWTAGSLASLAAAGVESLTYFETAGARGVIDAEPERPELAAPLRVPGGVFPAFHVLADAAALARTGSPIDVSPSDPDTIAGIATVGAGGACVALVANLTSEARVVEIHSLPAAQVAVRVLDAASAWRAMTRPDAFRSELEPKAVTAGTIRLDLGGFAVAFIDSRSRPAAGGGRQ